MTQNSSRLFDIIDDSFDWNALPPVMNRFGYIFSMSYIVSDAIADTIRSDIDGERKWWISTPASRGTEV